MPKPYLAFDALPHLRKVFEGKEKYTLCLEGSAEQEEKKYKKAPPAVSNRDKQ